MLISRAAPYSTTAEPKIKPSFKVLYIYYIISLLNTLFVQKELLYGSRFDGVRSLRSRRKVEQVAGIEPAPAAWKAAVLAVILYLQIQVLTFASTCEEIGIKERG